MSRKYNTKHPNRARSNYPARLEARGLSKAPQMPTLEYLRRHQATESWLAAHSTIAAMVKAFHGE